MVIKRKRSDSEVSTSFMLSSPPPSHAMDTSYTTPFGPQSVMESTPSHLSSRTRKRHRDNRPSESKIHEHTLSILFAAQKTAQQLATPPKTALPPTDHIPQQTSLHSFWAIPSRPPSCGSTDASISPPPFPVLHATHCEDCDRPFKPVNDDDAMDVDMDTNMYGGEPESACTTCGKQVCDSCAVSNLGAERQCLVCSGKKTWVGGIGWMDQD